MARRVCPRLTFEPHSIASGETGVPGESGGGVRRLRASLGDRIGRGCWRRELALLHLRALEGRERPSLPFGKRLLLRFAQALLPPRYVSSASKDHSGHGSKSEPRQNEDSNELDEKQHRGPAARSNRRCPEQDRADRNQYSLDAQRDRPVALQERVLPGDPCEQKSHVIWVPRSSHFLFGWYLRSSGPVGGSTSAAARTPLAKDPLSDGSVKAGLG